MEQARNPAIDRFRGFAVLMMAVVNYLGGVNAVPAFLKHAPDIGFTVADAVAPWFLFAIGLTYRTSFEKRRQAGALNAYVHMIARYFAILGIGALFSAGGAAVAAQPADWGVLQAIGMAGIIALPFIRLPAGARLAAGIALLAAYQFALDRFLLSSVLSATHGGFFGAISWGAMLLLATSMADIRRRGTGPFALCCSALGAAGILASLITPVSKHRVSFSYVLIALAIAGLLFLLFEAGSRRWKGTGMLCWWGENPLALYVLHLLLLGLFALPPVAWWYADAPLWLCALQLAVLLIGITLVARALHRRGILIKL